MKNSILKYLLFGLFASLPFERLLTYEFLGFTLKLSYIFSVLIILYAIFHFKNLLKEKLASYEWALLVFWIISFATTFWSADKKLSLILNFVILLSFTVFFVLKRFIKIVKVNTVINFFIWLGVLTSLFAFWQFVGDSIGLAQNATGLANLYIKDIFGFPRVQSTFFEPSFFANFLLLPLALSAYSASLKTSPANITKFMIIAVAFFLTLSRGGFVALAISVVFVLVLAAIWKVVELRRTLKVFPYFLASIFISLCAIYLSAGNVGLSNYLHQAKNSADVVSENKSDEFNPTRGYTVRVALRNSFIHPFGVGTGAFGTLPEFESIRQVGNLRQTVNSIYPEMLIETGFFGLSAFLVFIGLFLRDLLLRSKKSLLLLFLSVAVTAMFVQFLSFSTYYLIYIWVFFAFAASMETYEKTK